MVGSSLTTSDRSTQCQGRQGNREGNHPGIAFVQRTNAAAHCTPGIDAGGYWMPVGNVECAFTSTVVDGYPMTGNCSAWRGTDGPFRARTGWAEAGGAFDALKLLGEHKAKRRFKAGPTFEVRVLACTYAGTVKRYAFRKSRQPRSRRSASRRARPSRSRAAEPGRLDAVGSER
jgi:hypothetical protein